MSASIERWNTFLSKVKAQADTYFDTARTESLPLFKKNNGDPMPVTTALHAIHLQLLALNHKIDATWTEQVAPLFQQEEIAPDTIDRCYEQGLLLQHRLSTEFRLLEVEINHQMALHILELAQADHVDSINCTQCSASLDIPASCYTLEHMICRFCQTVNTYEPGTYRRMVGAFSIDHLARWHAIDLLRHVWEVEGQLQLLRDDAYQNKKAEMKKAQHAYFSAYLTEVKKYRPDMDFEKELQIAMRNA